MAYFLSLKHRLHDAGNCQYFVARVKGADFYCLLRVQVNAKVFGNSDSVVGEQNGKEQSFLPPVIVSHRSSPSRVALRRARKRRALDRSGPLRTRSTMEGMRGTERPPTMLRRFPLWENLN